MRHLPHHLEIHARGLIIEVHMVNALSRLRLRLVITLELAIAGVIHTMHKTRYVLLGQDK